MIRDENKLYMPKLKTFKNIEDLILKGMLTL
jgi:hypothetical protein